MLKLKLSELKYAMKRRYMLRHVVRHSYINCCCLQFSVLDEISLTYYFSVPLPFSLLSPLFLPIPPSSHLPPLPSFLPPPYPTSPLPLTSFLPPPYPTPCPLLSLLFSLSSLPSSFFFCAFSLPSSPLPFLLPPPSCRALSSSVAMGKPYFLYSPLLARETPSTNRSWPSPMCPCSR